MKTNIVKAVLITSIISVAGFASAKSSPVYVASDNAVESQLCVAAATSSTKHMNAKLVASFSNQKLSKKYTLIANNLKCNGVPIADFAMQAGNDEIAKKLASYMDKNVTIHDIAKLDDDRSAS